MTTKTPLHRQSGATLIEVLVAILILSFGMLALGGMLAYAVQMPKLAAFRASATMIANGHVERMRANLNAFKAGAYNETMTYSGVVTAPTACSYPSCSETDIANADKYETNTMLRRELPGGTAGMRMVCAGDCNAADHPQGDIWIMWDEPSTFASLQNSNSDECPDASAVPTFTPFGTPKPRCLHIRFTL